MNKTQSCRTLAVAVALIVFFAGETGYSQSYTVLDDLGRVSGGPIEEVGQLAQGGDGTLYGTAGGGANSDANGNPRGSIYKLNAAGEVRVLYSFCPQPGCLDGYAPAVGLTLRPDGHFLGAAASGGTSNAGTIFDITESGSFTLLYSFTGGSDGGSPFTPLVMGPDGNFYGTAFVGGNTTDCGTAFRLTAASTGISAAFTLLHKFNGGAEGCNPISLVVGSDGNLYGLNKAGGSHGVGTVFKMTRNGGVTLLHTFSGLADGAFPSGLTLGNDGNFYGTDLGTPQTGPSVIFKITPSGTFTVLHTPTETEGNNIYATLFLASDGNFYGTANLGGTSTNPACLVYAAITGCGTLFRVTPAGDFTVLYDFDFTTGFDALTAPFQHTSGLFYGVTTFGGIYDLGGYCFPRNCGLLYTLNENLLPYAALIPTQAKVGIPVEILGQGFTSSTTVSFNGMPAGEVKVASPTRLTATVPGGATSGFVTVTTSSGTLTSNQLFTVAP